MPVGYTVAIAKPIGWYLMPDIVDDQGHKVGHILYRKCWDCIFNDDIDHAKCNGNATDSEDLDAYKDAIKVWHWLSAMGPVPMEMPTQGQGGYDGRCQTPYGHLYLGPNPGNHPGKDRPFYPCACWCQRPELYERKAWERAVKAAVERGDRIG
jgi:hypothetical protein